MRKWVKLRFSVLICSPNFCSKRKPLLHHNWSLLVIVIHELDCAEPCWTYVVLFILHLGLLILCLYRCQQKPQRCCDSFWRVIGNGLSPYIWHFLEIENGQGAIVNPEAFLFTAVHADFDALLVDDCIDEAHASELELVKVENSQRSSRNTVCSSHILNWNIWTARFDSLLARACKM